MKLTFKLVQATNLQAFETAVNEYLANGYKFVNSMQVIVSPWEDIAGPGYQYSICMLLEEENK